jgi:hypothetical protein
VPNDQEKIHRLLGKVELNGSRNQPQVRSDLLKEAFVLVSRTIQRCYIFCHKYFRHVTLYNCVTNNSITSHFNFVSHFTFVSHVIQSLYTPHLCHTHYNHVTICFYNTYFLYIKILKQFQVSSLSNLMPVYAGKYQDAIFPGNDVVKFGSYLQCFVRTSCLHL